LDCPWLDLNSKDELMNRAFLTITILAGCMSLAISRPASAQESRTRRPTMSPYFNLYRQDGAGIDNYNAFVRPEMELRTMMGRQQMTIMRQGTNINAIQHQMLGRQRGISRTTSSASVFMDYSHYYPRPNALMSRGRLGRRGY
jgi:hypothetical protein